ncbi:MAG TPA: Rv3235 family protein [Streptosporangiaceae bacterium]|nr:Rv3235 family protein [Streptosporangiaceae bacterium]
MSVECQEPPPPRHSPATARPEGGLSPLAPVLPLIPRAPVPRRPLPDAIAVVRPLSLPRTAPPYDDQPADRSDGVPTRARLPHAATQAGQPRTAPPPSTAPPGIAPPGTAPPGTGPSPGGPPHGWPQHFAQVLAETLSGARPPRQITPWTTSQALRRIERLGPALALDATPQVRRLVTFRPSADVMEMTVVIGVGPRTRALAVRLERDRLSAAPPNTPSRVPWRCTAIEAA